MELAAAMLLGTLLLTILYGRTNWTIAAIPEILLLAAAVFYGAADHGIELDISAPMGLTMIVGQVTELIVLYLADLSSVKYKF